MEKPTQDWREYERLIQGIVQRLSAADSPERVRHDVKVKGANTAHQIDVLWEPDPTLTGTSSGAFCLSASTTTSPSPKVTCSHLALLLGRFSLCMARRSEFSSPPLATTGPGSNRAKTNGYGAVARLRHLLRSGRRPWESSLASSASTSTVMMPKKLMFSLWAGEMWARIWSGMSRPWAGEDRVTLQ